MLVLVAGNASSGNTQVGPAGIFDFYRRAFLRRNARRIVALVAIQSSVLAFEYISRVLMVERLDVPLDEGKVLAIVLGVTSGAFLA
jgi:hypothetical protein